MFGRDICGGIKPLLGPAAAPFESLLFLPPLLLLPPPPSGFLRLGVVSGTSSDATGADMKDAELVSTESKRSAAEGKDICFLVHGRREEQESGVAACGHDVLLNSRWARRTHTPVDCM